MELDGPSPEIYSAIGRAYYHLEDYSTSIDYFQRSIKIDQFFKDNNVSQEEQNELSDAVEIVL